MNKQTSYKYKSLKEGTHTKKRKTTKKKNIMDRCLLDDSDVMYMHN